MLQCSSGLRHVASSARTLDEAATAVVGFLYSEFADAETKEPQCALVRFYKTIAFGELDSSLKEFARRKLGSVVLKPDNKVLTLISTVGMEPQWCDPRFSIDHRAIPLPSVEIVEKAPMIAGLIKALGLEIATIVAPSVELLPDAAGKTYNVFHVEHASGSHFIPAQTEFVERYGIRSVVGFGGILPTGDFFALVMFTRVQVPAAAASRFRNVALDVKAIMHPFAVTA